MRLRLRLRLCLRPRLRQFYPISASAWNDKVARHRTFINQQARDEVQDQTRPALSAIAKPVAQPSGTLAALRVRTYVVHDARVASTQRTMLAHDAARAELDALVRQR